MREHEPIHEYAEAKEKLTELMKPRPTVIGLEGGPCGGKTTLAERLKNLDSDRPIVVLPEAASQHIAKLQEQGISVGELAENDRDGYLAFQADILRTINENIDKATEAYSGTDAIIIADRCDIGAYLAPEEYRQILDNLGMDMPPMLSKIDQIHYLPSVARQAPKKYDELMATNSARYETLEQAQATCQANLAAVARHPELHVAWGNELEKFDEKMDSLIQNIINPENETEYAFEWNNAADVIKRARNLGNFLSSQQIEQSYHQLDGQEFRLRKTVTEHGEELYSFTVKQGDGHERHELQRRLTEEEYDLLAKTPRESRMLRKTRYEFLKRNLLAHAPLVKHSADFYHDPDLLRWQVEVEVNDNHLDQNFLELFSRYEQDGIPGGITRIRAKDLAMR